MYTLISKFVIIHAKKQVEKNKIEADPDSDGGENHACTRQFKKNNSTGSLHVIHPQLLKIRHHSCKETGWKIRKIEADSDSDRGENHACTRQFKKTIALQLVAYYSSTAAQAKYNYMFVLKYICIFGLKK